MQGSLESSVKERSLLYQLILIQAVCEKKSNFSEVPALVNNHPMLQDSARIDVNSARAFYEVLLKHYGITGTSQQDSLAEPQEPKSESADEPMDESKVKQEPKPDTETKAKTKTKAEQENKQENKQEYGEPAEGEINLEHLDKLVNTLYMKYSQELLDTIAAEKQEFNKVLATIKP